MHFMYVDRSLCLIMINCTWLSFSKPLLMVCRLLNNIVASSYFQKRHRVGLAQSVACPPLAR